MQAIFHDLMICSPICYHCAKAAPLTHTHSIPLNSRPAHVKCQYIPNPSCSLTPTLFWLSCNQYLFSLFLFLSVLLASGFQVRCTLTMLRWWFMMTYGLFVCLLVCLFGNLHPHVLHEAVVVENAHFFQDAERIIALK